MGRLAGLFSMLFMGANLVSGLSGCAYSMGIADRRLPEGYQLVSVPVFKNLTQEVGIEVPFTNAMIREFARSQVAKVVDKSGAQVVLEGTIEQVRYDVAAQIAGTSDLKTSLIPDNTILNSQYWIYVWTKLVLKRASDGHVLWSEVFTGTKSYLAPKVGLPGLNSANALYNQSARQQNLNDIAGDMMAEAHGRLTENF